MSSDSEEENRIRQEADDSDGGAYDRRSRSRSRSRSAEMSHHSDDNRDNRHIGSEDEHSPGRRENGIRDSDIEKNDDQPERSRSRSPENKEMVEWSGDADDKRSSRSRSKSKPRDLDSIKERKSSSSSSSKKKSRSRRSHSRSRSRRRSRSRNRRNRSRSRRSRSRSRSRGSSDVMAARIRNDCRMRSRRRSRSRSRRRSRSRSRSGTPVDGARLHVAELDVDTRKRDLERVFEKYGRLREIWMARNPPCFAFVVYAHQKDADRALKETDGIMIGHCRIKVTQARPRVRGGRMRGGYDPNLRCYQCGELGHFSRNCTDTKFGYKRPPTPPGNVTSANVAGRLYPVCDGYVTNAGGGARAHRMRSRYKSRSRSRSRHHSRSRSRS